MSVRPAAGSPFRATEDQIRQPLELVVYGHDDLPQLGVAPLIGITGEPVSWEELPIPGDATLPARNAPGNPLPRHVQVAIDREAELWHVLRTFVGDEAWQRPGGYARMTRNGLEVNAPAGVQARVAALFAALREEESREFLVDATLELALVDPQALRPLATVFPLPNGARGVHVLVRTRDFREWFERVEDRDGLRHWASPRLTAAPGQHAATRLVQRRHFVRYHAPIAATGNDAGARPFAGSQDEYSQVVTETDERGVVVAMRAVPRTGAGTYVMSLALEVAPPLPFESLPIGDGRREVQFAVGAITRHSVTASIPAGYTLLHVLPDLMFGMTTDDDTSRNDRRFGVVLLAVTPRDADRDNYR